MLMTRSEWLLANIVVIVATKRIQLNDDEQGDRWEMYKYQSNNLSDVDFNSERCPRLADELKSTIRVHKNADFKLFSVKITTFSTKCDFSRKKCLHFSIKSMVQKSNEFVCRINSIRFEKKRKEAI